MKTFFVVVGMIMLGVLSVSMVLAQGHSARCLTMGMGSGYPQLDEQYCSCQEQCPGFATGKGEMPGTKPWNDLVSDCKKACFKDWEGAIKVRSSFR
jgi:hypothetical protein